MEVKIKNFYMMLLIFILASCAPPPPPKPIDIATVESQPIIKKDNNFVSFFKRLDSSGAILVMQNSTSIVKFYEEYKTEEHELVLVPKNLSDGFCFTGWSFSMSSYGINIDEFNNTCEILDKTELTPTESKCSANVTLNNDTNRISLQYKYCLHNTEILKIKFKYNKTDVYKEILYKTEYAIIPFIQGFSFCNYTFILSEGYLSLGLSKNILKKESDNIYTFFGECPINSVSDEIRFSPEKTFWKAETEVFLNSTGLLKNDVSFFFPRYYRGAKLENTYYKIYSSLNEPYEEEDIIHDDLKFKVVVPDPNQTLVTAKLTTGFINDLKADFKVNIPESYYEINYTEIPEEIKNKTLEIINENKDKPYYYSIGKFVNSHMTYNISCLGKTIPLKEIFEKGQGVCEHYTLLYNAMLNSIGIKSMYISGWAFQGDKISGNKDTIGHAWTVALIDGKWIELDSTWGLFEGIPAGHIFKTFFSDSYSYSWSSLDTGEKNYGQNRTIQLYRDINDIYDIITDETNLLSTYQEIISSSEGEASLSTNKETDLPFEETSNIPSEELIDSLSEKLSNDFSEISSNDFSEKISNAPLEKSSYIFSEEVSHITSEMSSNSFSDKEESDIPSKLSSDISSEKSYFPLEESTNVQSEKEINDSSEETKEAFSKEISNSSIEESNGISSEEASHIHSEELINSLTEYVSNTPFEELSNSFTDKISNIPFQQSSNIIPKEVSDVSSEIFSNSLSEKITNVPLEELGSSILKELSNSLSEEVSNIPSEKSSNSNIISKEVSTTPSDVLFNSLSEETRIDSSEEIRNSFSEQLTNDSLEKFSNIPSELASNTFTKEISNIQSEKMSFAFSEEVNKFSSEISSNGLSDESDEAISFSSEITSNTLSDEANNFSSEITSNALSDEATNFSSEITSNTLSDKRSNIQSLISSTIASEQVSNIQSELLSNSLSEEISNSLLKLSTNTFSEEESETLWEKSSIISFEKTSDTPSQLSSNILTDEINNVSSEISQNSLTEEINHISSEISSNSISKEFSSAFSEYASNVPFEEENSIKSTKISSNILSEELNDISTELSSNILSEELNDISTELSSNTLSEEISDTPLQLSSNILSEELNDISTEISSNTLSGEISNSPSEVTSNSLSENLNNVLSELSSNFSPEQTNSNHLEEISNTSLEEKSNFHSEDESNTFSDNSSNSPSNEENEVLSEEVEKTQSEDLPSQEANYISSEIPSDVYLEKTSNIPSKESSIISSEEITNIPKVEPTNVANNESTIILNDETIQISTISQTNTHKEETTDIQGEKTTNIPIDKTNNIKTDEATDETDQKSLISTNEESNHPIKETNKESINEITSSNSIVEENYITNKITTNTVTPESSYNKKEEEESNTSKEKESDNLNNETSVLIKDTSKKESSITYNPNNSIPITIPQTMATTYPMIMPTDMDENNSNTTLAFRQLQNFTQNEKNDITFDFFGVTKESQSKISKRIMIYVNLIKSNGEREENVRESFCVLYDIKDIGFANQAHYICSINNLKEKYLSFRFNSSEYISGIPDDEFSLDPHMTQKYINENKIDDVLKDSKISIFTIKSINHDSCNKNGVFTIIGNISQEFSESIVFTIPLKEPKEGIKATCNLTNSQIECKVDREINNNIIEIEEYIINENYKEILFLSSFKTKEKITCKNILYEESTQKKEITISFRQVSHLTQIKYGFTFYLITLMRKSYKKDYQLYINMNVFIKEIKTEKNAICILENDVSLNDGGIAQGNFKCSVSLTKEEYKNTNFKTISISSNNDNISGVSDLDEVTSNPYRTDEFMKDIKNKKSQGHSINGLTDIIDYYSEMNKNFPVFNIDSIYMNDCHNKGKLYITGDLSDDITEKIKFDLPLTYPTAEIKCELDEVNKNSKTNITCKTQKKFGNIKSLIIEPRLIKKKNKEIVFINGKQVNFEKKIECENYNSIKLEISKKRQNNKFTFLQLSQFNPRKNGLNFFMALIKNNLNYFFNNIFTISIKIIISNKRLLRNLDEISQSLIPVSCSLNETLKTDLAAGYDCSNTGPISGTPLDMEILTDDIEDISGIPENANPDKLKNIIDYSNINNLKKINELPVVNITNINGDTCIENGQYTITAKLVEKKNNNLKNKYQNIEIRFSSPESSALCEINIDENIIMTCENKEKFDVSQILIEKNVVQDQEGNDIFIINSFTNLEVFRCDISYNSIIIPKNETVEPENSGESEIKTINYYRNGKKGGLSGGSIAAIVISCIAIVVIVVVLIILGRKGLLFGKKRTKNYIPTELSHEKFNVYN